MMASRRRALRVLPLVLESHAKLAAALGRAVTEHLLSQVGRDISTVGLHASE